MVEAAPGPAFAVVKRIRVIEAARNVRHGCHSEWMEEGEYIQWHIGRKAKGPAAAKLQWDKFFADGDIKRRQDGDWQPDGSRALRLLLPLTDFVDVEQSSGVRDQVVFEAKDQKLKGAQVCRASSIVESTCGWSGMGTQIYGSVHVVNHAWSLS